MAPVFTTATIATIAAAERGNNSATRCPGPAPRVANTCAARLAASSSSRYVIDEPSKVTAIASGVRAACAANIDAIDSGLLTDRVSAARLPT